MLCAKSKRATNLFRFFISFSLHFIANRNNIVVGDYSMCVLYVFDHVWGQFTVTDQLDALMPKQYSFHWPVNCLSNHFFVLRMKIEKEHEQEKVADRNCFCCWPFVSIGKQFVVSEFIFFFFFSRLFDYQFLSHFPLFVFIVRKWSIVKKKKKTLIYWVFLSLFFFYHYYYYYYVKKKDRKMNRKVSITE